MPEKPSHKRRCPAVPCIYRCLACEFDALNEPEIEWRLSITMSLSPRARNCEHALNGCSHRQRSFHITPPSTVDAGSASLITIQQSGPVLFSKSILLHWTCNACCDLESTAAGSSQSSVIWEDMAAVVKSISDKKALPSRASASAPWEATCTHA